MKSFFIKTLGCKVNQCDSQEIREKLLSYGLREAKESDADFRIVNTCCVTRHADRKSRYAIREAAGDGRRSRVAVTGCYVGYRRSQVAAMSGVDAVFSNEDKDAVAEWVLKGNRASSRAEAHSEFVKPPYSPGRGKTRAFLKIQDGCDNRCSFCVIPFVRGRSRSKPPRQVVLEAKSCVEAGYKEIVLTGVCLGSYGRDLLPRLGLVDIVEELEQIEGLMRLRISSLEASHVTLRLLEKMSASPKLCPHLHIPFQSGDDEVLRGMNKKSSVADYTALVERARLLVRDLTVTCDVIVGFPTEEEGHFRNTVGFLEAVKPLKTHIFSYSEREGTAISKQRLRVSAAAVRERFLTLKELTDKISFEKHKDFLGKEAEVLFESGENGIWTGYTKNYLKVCIPSAYSLANAVKTVRIKLVENNYVEGEAVD